MTATQSALAARSFPGCISCNTSVPVAALGPGLSRIQAGLCRISGQASGNRWTRYYRDISCTMETGEALFAPCSLVCHTFCEMYSYPVLLLLDFVTVRSRKGKRERKRGGAGERKKRETGRQPGYVQISEQRGNFVVCIFKWTSEGR